ncbi:MAG: hypothetical protein AABZ84_04725 [Pseudomonadota bacterium]
MPKTANDEGIAPVDDFADGETWTDDTSEAGATQKSAPVARYAPKWRNIEQYWEEKRLREQLKDDLLDDA